MIGIGRRNGDEPGGTRPAWPAHVTVHSLAWLVVGGAVGLWLSLLLLVPSLGRLIEPLSYGRWIPVHFDSQLYGWLSLPLIGVLFRAYLPREAGGFWPGVAVSCWSGSLLFAIVCWLGGHSSGKLFLEWTGPSRVVMAAGMTVLACVLLASYRRRRAREAGPSEPVGRRVLAAAKWALLLALFAVPAVMYWASGPAVYPSINPDSGGATGSSLLGSTLGIVAVIWLTPWLAGLRRRGGPGIALGTGVALLVHFAGFGLMDHGNRSHHEMSQILGLASLLVWPPLLVVYSRSFEWPAATRRWLFAFCGWGSALVLTAVPTFLPGVLEAWKYTNALVGHAHLAMAGMLTSFVVILLVAINRGTPLEAAFSEPAAFYLWHAGLVLHILSLLVMGVLESAGPAPLYRSDPIVQVLYTGRLIGGAAMWLASLRWAGSALRACADDRTATGEREEARRVAA